MISKSSSYASWWDVDCASGDGCEGQPSLSRRTEAAAIAAWNTRPEDPELAALRKELSDTKALLEQKNDACRSHLIDLDDAQTERDEARKEASERLKERNEVLDVLASSECELRITQEKHNKTLAELTEVYSILNNIDRLKSKLLLYTSFAEADALNNELYEAREKLCRLRAKQKEGK